MAACSLCLALDGRAGLYALILGELCTVPYLLFRKKESKTKDYPLIPFLFAGFLVVLLFEGNKVVQKGVYAKMARGEMVRFMAGIHAETPEQMKDWGWSGYHYDEGRSSDSEYVFIRTEVPGFLISGYGFIDCSVNEGGCAFTHAFSVCLNDGSLLRGDADLYLDKSIIMSNKNRRSVKIS